MTLHDTYTTDDAYGVDWHLMLGDSCERLAEIPDQSVHLSVYSPPFDSLYTYSPSPRDLGNSASRAEFLEHYGYVIRENLRVTMPGRRCCVHVQDIATTKAKDGLVSVTDFSGDVIRAYQAAGWIYHGRVTVNKNPQAQAIKTKVQALMFVTKNKDSSKTRPALPDYLLMFSAPGDNPVPIKTDVTNDEWIDWAQPVWLDIKETNTLNARVAREHADERHIAPLQLEFIERCVRLWSNPGETVLSPFAGIGSEIYMAVKLGRRGIGCELKPSYWRTAVNNLRELESSAPEPTLFGGGRLVTDTPTLGQPLSPRETEVLGHRAEGLTIPEIAKLLHLSRSTIRNTVMRAYAKLGARNGPHAIHLWYQRRARDEAHTPYWDQVRANGVGPAGYDSFGFIAADIARAREDDAADREVQRG